MRRHRSIIRIVVIGTLLFIRSAHPASASAPNWPQFRGPGGLGIAPDSQTYPAELDMSRNVLWKTEVPEGYSSPCIWADNIFLTACSGKVLETLCIDRADGRIKWRRTVQPEVMQRTGPTQAAARHK